jgi:hypothetical protein
MTLLIKLGNEKQMNMKYTIKNGDEEKDSRLFCTNDISKVTKGINVSDNM